MVRGDLGRTGGVSLGLPDLLAPTYLAVGVSATATVAWYAAVPRLGADRAGLFYAFSPVGALAAGLVLGTSHLSVGKLLGLVVVMAGLLTGLRRPGDRLQSVPRGTIHRCRNAGSTLAMCSKSES